MRAGRRPEAGRDDSAEAGRGENEDGACAPSHGLVSIIAGLRGEELACALRWRLAPVMRARGRCWCVAGGAPAAAEAARRGWHVLCRVPSSTFLDALTVAHGGRLARNAALALARRHPLLSAAARLAPRQAGRLRTLVPVVFLLAWAKPLIAVLLLLALPTITFLLLAAIRVVALWSLPRPCTGPVLAEQALPHYTVLVPVYREIGVLDQLLAALEALDYPPEKRDIKILVEHDDRVMRVALSHRVLPTGAEVLIVPPGTPRTKPRALNYGLAFARGDLLCIFDAEDVPAPDQLRRSAHAFAVASPRLACLQAGLGWYNAGENWLTRMLAVDYAGHFEVTLPFLARLGWPLPLGGTSNHFRTEVLRAVGAWDPFNVTEDADLGLRLARGGWRTGVLDSHTGEEACVRLRDWLCQRSRWIKGWLQTWLVHVRTHHHFVRATGVGGLMVLHGIIGAGVFAALAHPLFLAWTLWNVLFPGGGHALGHSLAASLGAVVLATGHFCGMALGAVGLHRRGQLHLWPWLFTLPVYWLLVSAAAWLALWDFLVRPHHWRKTPHGVSRRRAGRRGGGGRACGGKCAGGR